jgi:hypothetical protein
MTGGHLNALPAAEKVPLVDFYAKAKGLNENEACREIIRRAEGGPAETQRASASRSAAKSEVPPLAPYSQNSAQRVTDNRGLRITAVEFAAIWLKTVVFARACEQECWILTDASRKCAEARRVNAKPFPAVGTLAERKSHSLAGSRKSWPVGILPGGIEEPWLRSNVRKILLVEGGPDYLAACQLIAAQDESILPVAMLGASASIDPEALKYFTCREVTILAHPDQAGREAAMRWGTQL